MSVLERCPWCKPEVNDINLLCVTLASGPYFNGKAVFCQRCGVRGPVKGTLDTALDAWNTFAKREKKVCRSM